VVEKHNNEHYPKTSGGKGTHAKKNGKFKTYRVRTKFDAWGRKRWENPKDFQQFPNERAKIL
jgi:hypothetical protein